MPRSPRIRSRRRSGRPAGRLRAGLAGLVLGLALTAAVPVAASADETDPVGVWPLVPEPPVVAGFDPPSDPWGAGHRGVDLRGRPGQPVRAALPGTVTFAARLAGRGVVVVDHGSTRTTYEPVAASVAVGDAVGAGARLGSLEYAGSHCPPAACLHWGWIEGERTYLDPLRLVGGGPVRLLPLWRAEPVGGRGAESTRPGAPLPWPEPFLLARAAALAGPPTCALPGPQARGWACR
ncbi:M23 family metallopeptidase [Nocardioides pantholopis]|uniref:M23 family metallopeptidase n=1 Tax=Nocardioides pantholopis TaxID=2483798 RepID=UPI000F0936A6|nr:M23 family metallopeptidase [Nocardioides pantholopis]